MQLPYTKQPTTLLGQPWSLVHLPTSVTSCSNFNIPCLGSAINGHQNLFRSYEYKKNKKKQLQTRGPLSRFFNPSFHWQRYFYSLTKPVEHLQLSTTIKKSVVRTYFMWDSTDKKTWGFYLCVYAYNSSTLHSPKNTLMLRGEPQLPSAMMALSLAAIWAIILKIISICRQQGRRKQSKKM